jgi:hypothetical protein
MSMHVVGHADQNATTSVDGVLIGGRGCCGGVVVGFRLEVCLTVSRECFGGGDVMSGVRKP